MNKIVRWYPYFAGIIVEVLIDRGTSVSGGGW